MAFAVAGAQPPELQPTAPPLEATGELLEHISESSRATARARAPRGATSRHTAEPGQAARRGATARPATRCRWRLARRARCCRAPRSRRLACCECGRAVAGTWRVRAGACGSARPTRARGGGASHSAFTVFPPSRSGAGGGSPPSARAGSGAPGGRRAWRRARTATAPARVERERRLAALAAREGASVAAAAFAAGVLAGVAYDGSSDALSGRGLGSSRVDSSSPAPAPSSERRTTGRPRASPTSARRDGAPRR